MISGFPGHPVEDIKRDGIRIIYKGGGTDAQAALKPAEKENAYPEPGMFESTPSYGFYIRHVKGIEFNNVQVSFTDEEARPAFFLQDVTNAGFLHIKAKRSEGVPEFVLKNVENFSTHYAISVPDTVVIKTENIRF